MGHPHELASEQAMQNILGGEHLERELTPEPVAGPAAGAVGLHVALLAAVALYGAALGLFHHNLWGSRGAGGAMQVTLASALPLPAEQTNQNVLATETPSQAPAEPSPKQKTRSEEKAIPIPGQRRETNHRPKPATPAAPAPAEQCGALRRAGRFVDAAGDEGGDRMGRRRWATTVLPAFTRGMCRASTNTMANKWNKYEVNPAHAQGSAGLHRLHNS